MNLSLTIDRLLNASPERLYEVWTNPQHLSKWFGVRVDADPKVGGLIRFHFGEASGPVVGNFVALEPGRYVAFTWTNYSADDGPETTVHLTFDRVGSKCRLTLKQEGFTSQKAYDSHDEGWLVYFELWSARSSVGEASETFLASIADTFPIHINVLETFAGWVGKTQAQLDTIESSDGLRIIKAENLEARLMPCRFGSCLSLAEWGFKTQEEQLAARTKWQNRFARLKDNPK